MITGNVLTEITWIRDPLFESLLDLFTRNLETAMFLFFFWLKQVPKVLLIVTKKIKNHENNPDEAEITKMKFPPNILSRFNQK